MIGNAEPKRLLLGSGDIYLDDVFVGNLKGAVELKVTPTYAFGRPGNSLVDIKAERTGMSAVLSAQICDFKVAQLRKALGINQAIFSGSSTMRIQDVLTLPTGTSLVSLTHTAVAGTFKVMKLDRSVTYVTATDYSATTTQINKKANGGAITVNQVVIVEYDTLDTASNSVQVGGEKTTPNTFRVDFVHEMSNGKRVQVVLYKGVVTTDLTIAFDEKASGNFTVHGLQIKALADPTKAEGVNLFEIIEEDPTTAS